MLALLGASHWAIQIMQLTVIQCPLYIILCYGPIRQALCLTQWLQASAIAFSYGQFICPLYIHFGYGLLLFWHIASLQNTYASCRLLLTLPSSSYAHALRPNAPPSSTQWLLLTDLPCCSHPRARQLISRSAAFLLMPNPRLCFRAARNLSR